MFGFFSRKEREERRIYRQMMARARDVVRQTYLTDRKVRAMHSADVTAEVLQKLVDACAYDLKVEHQFPDGHKLTFTRQISPGELDKIQNRFGMQDFGMLDADEKQG
jgi:hypothetical protein